MNISEVQLEVQKNSFVCEIMAFENVAENSAYGFFQLNLPRINEERG